MMGVTGFEHRGSGVKSVAGTMSFAAILETFGDPPGSRSGTLRSNGWRLSYLRFQPGQQRLSIGSKGPAMAVPLESFLRQDGGSYAVTQVILLSVAEGTDGKSLI